MISLRLLLMMFYAPTHAIGEVRDRAPLAQAALVAIVAGIIFGLCAQLPYIRSAADLRRALLGVLLQSVYSLLIAALVFVPVTILTANLFERRGSFGIVLRQEYAATASALFYALAAASLAATPLITLAIVSNQHIAFAQGWLDMMAWAQRNGATISDDALNPRIPVLIFFWLLSVPFTLFWIVIAVRELFRFSWLRAIAVVMISSIGLISVAPLMQWLFGQLLAFPLLLLFLFFLLRGYVGELVGAQRARAAFKQNLQAATLNPADASAHYNLGLIHLQRKEFDQARASFERAVEIDADETDAHFQLGRISRIEQHYAEAIKHFEPVVERDPAHAQHEIWREVGATYLAAEQFEDARDALERFLEKREADPEGLYLMGRALAALGRGREAAATLRACIEAVKNAPAYKYRAEKRWLNEAQQFLRTLEA